MPRYFMGKFARIAGNPSRGTAMLFWKFVARPVTSPNNASIEERF
jgi:hypothetical protein